MDNQQGPTVEHLEFCSMLCGGGDGRGPWGRKGTCVCMAQSLHCSCETITTLCADRLYPSAKEKVKTPNEAIII